MYFDKIQTQYVDIYAGKVKTVIFRLKFEGFSPYLENTTYLVFFLFFTILLFYFISYLAKFFISPEINQLSEKNLH